MNFTEKSETGIPLWWLVFTGQKTCTRRAPACLHCGKKWAEHTRIESRVVGIVNPDMRLEMVTCEDYSTLTEKVVAQNGYSPPQYEPDLSRWQPSIQLKKGQLVKRLEDITRENAKTIAICPGRGKASVCKNCGGWKSWHEDKHNVLNEGYFIHAEQVGGMLSTRAEYSFAFSEGGELHKICSNYAPLRKKVVGCELESEWLKKFMRMDKPENLPEKIMGRYVGIDLAKHDFLDEEAHREGFNSWEGLQVALKRVNPKNAPLYRIEFEGEKL
jgi:hypothetical protein